LFRAQKRWCKMYFIWMPKLRRTSVNAVISPYLHISHLFLSKWHGRESLHVTLGCSLFLFGFCSKNFSNVISQGWFFKTGLEPDRLTLSEQFMSFPSLDEMKLIHFVDSKQRKHLFYITATKYFNYWQQFWLHSCLCSILVLKCKLFWKIKCHVEKGIVNSHLTSVAYSSYQHAKLC
jgi:hypothetical protein